MSFNRKTVPISSIDSDDETFRITTDKLTDELIGSIREIGLLNSPILLEKEPDRFSIISGFRRVSALKQLSFTHTEAKIVPSNADKSALVRLAITDNAFQRPLNIVEISRCVALLSEEPKTRRELGEAAQSLGLPKNPTMTGNIELICALPGFVRESVLNGVIPLAMALELATRFDTETKMAFATLFDQLKPSLNKQREIVTLVEEIAIREDITPCALLGATDVVDILTDENGDRNQIGGHLRRYLKKRRFPEITKAEEEFDSMLRRLKLGKKARLTPPKHFEGTIFNLSLSFNNLEELKEHRVKMEQIIENEDFIKMLQS